MRAARCSEVCERLANSVPNIEDRAIAAQVSMEGSRRAEFQSRAGRVAGRKAE
jgi:hypothetical protein